jgi:hypothetical protein
MASTATKKFNRDKACYLEHCVDRHKKNSTGLKPATSSIAATGTKKSLRIESLEAFRHL